MNTGDGCIATLTPYGCCMKIWQHGLWMFMEWLGTDIFSIAWGFFFRTVGPGGVIVQ